MSFFSFEKKNKKTCGKRKKKTYPVRQDRPAALLQEAVPGQDHRVEHALEEEGVSHPLGDQDVDPTSFLFLFLCFLSLFLSSLCSSSSSSASSSAGDPRQALDVLEPGVDDSHSRFFGVSTAARRSRGRKRAGKGPEAVGERVLPRERGDAGAGLDGDDGLRPRPGREQGEDARPGADVEHRRSLDQGGVFLGGIIESTAFREEGTNKSVSFFFVLSFEAAAGLGCKKKRQRKKKKSPLTSSAFL